MYTIGIDAGQTHLEIVFIDKTGDVVARGYGGPSHEQGKPMEEVFNHSLTEALKAIPFEKTLYQKVHCIGAGVTGIGIPGKKDSILKVLKQHFPNAFVFLDNDAVTSHWGATKGKDGISVLAGTGTIAYGKRQDKNYKLGGYGYLFGDEGSGWWIGINAIRRTLRSVEGRDLQTSLQEEIINYFNLKSIKQLSGEVYRKGNVPVKEIAAFAKNVSEMAKNGDPLSIDIFNKAGLELSILTCTMLDLLEVKSDEAFPVFCLGGVWKSGDILNKPFREGIVRNYPKLKFYVGSGNPAVGAALLALNHFDGE